MKRRQLFKSGLSALLFGSCVPRLATDTVKFYETWLLKGEPGSDIEIVESTSNRAIVRIAGLDFNRNNWRGWQFRLTTDGELVAVMRYRKTGAG